MDSPPVNKNKWAFHSDPEPLMMIYAVHERDNVSVTFSHALKIAYASGGNLEIVDVRKKELHDDVRVRRVLEKWGILPRDSQQEDVAKTGLHIKKIVIQGDVRKEIGKRLMRHRRDVMVIGTEKRNGFPQLFGNELVKYLSDRMRQTTLFVPADAKPFVCEQTGDVSLKRILVPVAETPSCEPSFKMLQRLTGIFPEQQVEVIGLHFGQTFPFVSASSLEGFVWTELLSESFSPSAILKVAAEQEVDLIAMSTHGRSTLTKRIIGSTTEQVLRHAPCPVLSVVV